MAAKMVKPHLICNPSWSSLRKVFLISIGIQISFLMFELWIGDRFSETDLSKRWKLRTEGGLRLSGFENVTEMEDPFREIPLLLDVETQREHLRNFTLLKCLTYECEQLEGLTHPNVLEGPVMPSSKNVTPPGSSLLIYNRVSKSGSRTTKEVLKKLNSILGFYLHKSKIFSNRTLAWDEQQKLVTSIKELKGSNVTCFERHFFYFNMTRYGLERPTLINVVRDPVEWFISTFYFRRDPVRWKTLPYLISAPKPPQPWFDKDLNTCMMEKDPECYLVPGENRKLIMTFFCGHHPACMELGNAGALQRAKRHAENYYSVVGLVEDMDLTFKVLEAYVPRFFAGAPKIYRNGDSAMHFNEGGLKPNVTEETKERLRQMMPLELEFYEFVKQRLQLQGEALNLL